MKFQILHRYSQSVLFELECGSLRLCVETAVKSHANLSGANLYGADLYGANLSFANLYRVDLYGANLSGADLSGANLSGANLSFANLYRVDLYGANLSGANLSFANLYRADLYGAKNLPPQAEAQTAILPEGDLIGWKRCKNGVLIKLKIPADAKRSNTTGRKCRAEFADVLEVIGAEVGVSQHDNLTKYEVGKRVVCDKWCEDRWQECAGGIHFFITRTEAENY